MIMWAGTKKKARYFICSSALCGPTHAPLENAVTMRPLSPLNKPETAGMKTQKGNKKKKKGIKRAGINAE